MAPCAIFAGALALVGRVTDEMNKLDAAIKTQLPQVNGMLQRQKLAPIKAEPLNPETEKK